MMRKLAFTLMAMASLYVVACVTINVYFPEAAAEKAADRIIDKVRGPEADGNTSLVSPDNPRDVPVLLALARSVTSFLISDANAQSDVDFDKPSPEKQALENSLASRFPLLRPYLNSGAIGLTDAGLLEFRDRNLVPLKDRNSVVQLVAAQNNDWNAL